MSLRKMPLNPGLDYEHTVMFGRYSGVGLEDARRQYLRQLSVTSSHSSGGNHQSGEFDNEVSSPLPIRQKILFTLRNLPKKLSWFTVENFGEDWIFLLLLGIIMALLSFAMELAIDILTATRQWLYHISLFNSGLAYVVWVGAPLILVLFAGAFVQVMSPQAIGSGLPEIKTIMRGVVLKEYLSFRTLVSKVIGLIAILASGIPIGKEGPLVHISSMVANLLSKLVSSFEGIYNNESRSHEMLAAATAVGVACTFGAPIGGVLFSIEVTSAYFQVRNYFRGFFAAAVSATLLLLLDVWANEKVSILAVYQTYFSIRFPYALVELIIFALIGIFCGFLGAFFVLAHRSVVLFVRGNRWVKAFFSLNRLLFPGLMSILIFTVTFPLGFGQFIAGEVGQAKAIKGCFANFSWHDNLTAQETSMIKEFMGTKGEIYTHLVLFFIVKFVLTVLANTMPIPSGIFTPVFMLGAVFGRLFGEVVKEIFQYGFLPYADINPGGYATIGAAALTGAVTHTVSVVVIVYEMTGQITLAVPLMLSTLIATAIATYIQPSIYDSVIWIKNLPYLPAILPTSSNIHKIFAKDFMTKEVKFLSMEDSYRDLQSLLAGSAIVDAFPLVDNRRTNILLGSIDRGELEKLLSLQTSEKARKAEAHRRFDRRDAQQPKSSTVETFPGRFRPKANSRKSSTPARLNFVKKLRRKRQVSFDQESKLSDASSEYNLSTISSHADSLIHSPTTPNFTMTIVEGEEMSNFQLPLKDEPQKPKLTMKRSQTFTHGDKENFPVDKPDGHQSMYKTVGSYLTTFGERIRKISRRKDSSRENLEDLVVEIVDLFGEERSQWEQKRLGKRVKFARLHIDPSPFQLVEQTSLYKTHSIFSLLDLRKAYVTALGKLVGVVSLNDLRKALEAAQSGVQTNKFRVKLKRVETDHMGTLRGSEAFRTFPGIQPSNELPSNVHTPQDSFKRYSSAKRASFKLTKTPSARRKNPRIFPSPNLNDSAIVHNISAVSLSSDLEVFGDFDTPEHSRVVTFA